MEVDPIEVGMRIRQIRKNILGVSMAEFGSRIDDKAKSGTVSNWETGKNLPNNERLKRIAELGNMSVDELLYGESIWKKFDEELGEEGLEQLRNEVKKIENDKEKKLNQDKLFENFFNRDIGEALEFMIEQLDNENENLRFEDEEMDEDAKQILRDALKSNLDIARRLNK